jgi:hypothetical protein
MDTLVALKPTAQLKKVSTQTTADMHSMLSFGG